MDRLSLPVLEQEQMKVQEIIHTPAGETVLDMGQNFAGYVEFAADFPAGTEIVLDFGEILQEGNFYNKNYRDAKSQFVYISDGRKEIVHPHFTYFGFRYVRVTGCLRLWSCLCAIILRTVFREKYMNRQELMEPESFLSSLRLLSRFQSQLLPLLV